MSFWLACGSALLLLAGCGLAMSIIEGWLAPAGASSHRTRHLLAWWTLRLLAPRSGGKRSHAPAIAALLAFAALALAADGWGRSAVKQLTPPLAGPGVTAGGTAMAVAAPAILGAIALALLACFASARVDGGKLAVLGGQRQAQQSLAALPPLTLALLAAAMRGQADSWLVLLDPFLAAAFGVAVVATLVVSARAAFDAPTASELAGGVLSEQSGRGLALFVMARRAILIALLATTVTLFLGGAQTLAGLAAKTLALWAALLLVRTNIPRQSADQATALCLKVLLPVAAVALVGTLAWRMAFPNGL